MASSGNFLTMNPLNKDTVALLSGNCKLNMATNQRGALGNIEIPLTGKWYFECFAQMGSGVEGYVGVSDIETDLTSSRGGITDSTMYGFGFSQYSGSNYFAIKVDGGTADNSGRIDTGSTNNAVLGIAVNRDDNEIKLYTNNTLRFTIAISATTLYYPFFGVGGASNASYFMYLNAGQDSTFGGNKTAGGNADGNGFGDFFYSPPSNHIALCSANLPISDDIDPAQTDDEIPTKQFDTILYAGNGSSQDITTLGFQPDLLWFKNRGTTNSNLLFDSSRGATKDLSSDKTNGESTSYSSIFTAFLSTGWRFGEGDAGLNNGSNNYVAWCWKANGGTTSSNSDGNVTSTIQNRKGFSIITYGGSGGQVSGANPTIGHGLGATPDFFIIKNRSANDAWFVWHNLFAANQFGLLNSSNAPLANAANAVMSNTLPSSSVITIASDGDGYNNTSSENYVCYAWCDVEGMQKFGSYEGNGNADGSFVYTGFRPRMIFVKDADRGENWVTFDSARNTFNSVDKGVFWNANSAESTGSGSGFDVDILANGFKMRCSHDNLNGSSTYIYGAWGDVPFKYNNAF